MWCHHKYIMKFWPFLKCYLWAILLWKIVSSLLKVSKLAVNSPKSLGLNTTKNSKLPQVKKHWPCLFWTFFRNDVKCRNAMHNKLLWIDLLCVYNVGVISSVNALDWAFISDGNAIYKTEGFLLTFLGRLHYFSCL